MPPNPMVEELLAVVEEETLHLRTLRAEAARTEDPSQRLEIERKVEAVKRETEVRLLGIQLEYAMREGRVEVAAYLEAAIASITAPPQRREPVPRPAPSPATAGRTEP